MICEYCMEEFTPKNARQKACDNCIKEGYTYDEGEREKNLKYTKAYQKKLRDAGVCITCRQPLDKKGSRCVKCTETARIKNAKYREENRERFNAYHREYNKKNKAKISENRRILREKAKQARVHEVIYQ